MEGRGEHAPSRQIKGAKMTPMIQSESPISGNMLFDWILVLHILFSATVGEPHLQEHALWQKPCDQNDHLKSRNMLFDKSGSGEDLPNQTKVREPHLKEHALRDQAPEIHEIRIRISGQTKTKMLLFYSFIYISYYLFSSQK
jgi:hypothetical protein